MRGRHGDDYFAAAPIMARIAAFSGAGSPGHARTTVAMCRSLSGIAPARTSGTETAWSAPIPRALHAARPSLGFNPAGREEVVDVGRPLRGRHRLHSAQRMIVRPKGVQLNPRALQLNKEWDPP